MDLRALRRAPADPSQLSIRSFATPIGTRSRSAQRRTAPSGLTAGASGIQQQPVFSMGPGESRGVVCAVCASNDVSREVGLAFINVPIAEAVLTAVSDTQFYPKTIHKIQMMEAARILMPPSPPAPHSGLELRSHVEDELPGVPIVEMAKADWSESDGMQAIRTVAAKADLPALEFAIHDNYYAVCALSAAMKYIRDEFGLSFDQHSVRIRYQPPADAMMVSLPTIRSLELISNAHNSRSKDCLFGVLNHTVTPMGSRILRSNILQPSTRAAILNPRWDAVGELSRNDSLLTGVQKALDELKPLGDVEQLLTKLVILPKDGSVYEFEQAINNILKLKAFLTAHEISANLDIQRKLYEEFSGKVHDYVNNLEDELRVRVNLKYTDIRKFYMRLHAKDFGPRGPPAIFINRTRSKDHIECQTFKLVEYNERINQAVNGAVIESDEIIKGILSDIRPRVSMLFKYCESIALVDLLASFAKLVRTYNYVRPEIQKNVFSLVEARHPILDSRGLGKCIPNDYFITEESRFQIITGQNMSGKSTYIRAIAMLQIMAQIGCYVPAESARMPIVHNLFARVSTDDNLEANLSTFSVEMREMAYILRNVNNRSLVIVDELGRATSTRDGLAIATAISEALLQSDATVYFATHFADLARALANRIGVANRHLKTETQHPHGHAADVPITRMLYRVENGPGTETGYGIALAKAVGFPASFIARAETTAAELRSRAKANQTNKHELEEAKRRKLVTNLVRQLRLAQQSKADDDELWRYLQQIHDDFWTKMLGSSESAAAESSRIVAEPTSDPAEESAAKAGNESDDYAVKNPVQIDLCSDSDDGDDADSYGYADEDDLAMLVDEAE
ncbi:DNA mismatch repair protein MutS, C-terminal domain protein [Niveomyces insectorum RCEF 264]|uniref:DNA mismatch repair protein MSH3 n=1 Tax=Niveomyces insectorum RCEF 264 TaxID=1081102 RepID=A0A167UP13_9HYPO|nr:DNA mismatch repair protein MutS, C-terminal domain protein [Niveomyces insectorum RCEF 264]